ncbi:TPA: cysteine hydrolase [Enterococcus faecium]|uniref:cysteine hydrolase n=1 Tax=Enterococcus faecium TaxID=1352 RepID=UPI00115B2EC5|nr:cysteine hydrolase [Enterococcus faecium]EGP4990119.1 cysteine hydrolase [Enterococcus faecium]EHG8745960.1 cysteine hydrolase [Enterococcus faecium]EME3438686.1 cysteine hydrolase [Enterococcus faecium]MCL6154981.1 cysteine hydrolase [Enterococcus faecium]MCZ1503626.1 cysteine hydrolase [Enterococcus faecium]
MNDLKENMIFDLSKTAFVAIDMQKGIVNNGTLSPHTAQSILTNNDLLAKTLKRTAALKVLVNVDISTFPYLSQQTDMGGMTASVPPEFTDLLLKDSLKDTNNMLTITKYNPSAFFGTSLDLQLRRRGIETIILSGVATTNGVYATALDAFQHGYHVVLAEDACSDRDKESHQLFIKKIFPKTARVRSTKQIIEAIQQSK